MKNKKISTCIIILLISVVLLYLYNIIAMHEMFGIISCVILLLAYIFSILKIKIPKKNFISLIISITTVVSVFVVHFIISNNPYTYKYDKIDGGIEITGYEYCIMNDYKARSIEIPSKIDGQKVKVIGEMAFHRSPHIKEIVVPEGVEIIKDGAFSGTKYTKLVLPSSLKKIGDYAFYSLNFNTYYVLLPAGLEYIGDEAFGFGARAILVSIGTNTEQWSKIWSTLIFPVYYDGIDVVTVDETVYVLKADSTATIVKINETAKKVNLLDSIEYNGLTYSVTTIGEEASNYCVYEEINIPNSITTIKRYAFRSDWLLKIFIPKSVIVVEEGIFSGCFFVVVDAEHTEKPETWADDWFNGTVNWGAVLDSTNN